MSVTVTPYISMMMRFAKKSQLPCRSPRHESNAILSADFSMMLSGDALFLKAQALLTSATNNFNFAMTSSLVVVLQHDAQFHRV